MRLRSLAAAVLAAATLAGCSSADTLATPDPTSDPTSDPTPSADPAVAAWSPCDGLTAAGVGEIVGAGVTEDAGTPGQPRCRFLPEQEGGPAFDLNYLWFDGGLDAALDSMGAAAGQLRPVEVPGAEAARLAANPQRSGVLVTGFVQTQGLVQSVNAVQLRPYDEDELVDATRRLLAELARQAPDAPS